MDKKVMIAVATSENGRHASFYDYFNLLDKPQNALCAFTHGQSPARGRNILIEQALEHDCTHIFFVDDDMAIKPDAVTRLMKHDVDIVGGLYLTRHYPHQPILFDWRQPDGQFHWMSLRPEQTGLIEVVGTGLGCILFDLKVFLALEKPYVRLGEIQADQWCDDLGLFNRILDKGFKVHVDLDVQVGHVGFMTMFPAYNDGKWFAQYDTKGTQLVQFPMVVEVGT